MTSTAENMQKQKPLSILMLAPELPPPGSSMTGSPAHIYKISRELVSAGVVVTLCAIDRPAANVSDRNSVGLLGRIWHLYKVLRMQRPDVLHCHGHKAAFLAIFLAKPMRIPLICEIHGYFNASAGEQRGARRVISRLLKWLEFPTLRMVDQIIAQSSSMKGFVLEKISCSTEKISVFYPGLNVAEFSEYLGPPAAIPGVTEETKVILYAGSTFAYQGLELLAQAQSYLVDTHPKARVVLVLSNSDADGTVVFKQFGFQPERTTVVDLVDSATLPAYLARADVLVHTRPDTPDNLNVQSKLGLYLASGKSIVATNVGDYPVIMSGSGGCLLTDPDANQIARALAEAIDNPEVADQAKVANPELAYMYFDSRTNIDRLSALYECLRQVV